MTPEPSPLALTDADSLSALFTSDPLNLTDAQLEGLITELRRRRNVFASDEAAKAAKGKTPRSKPGTVSAEAQAALDKPASEVSLDDLL